MAHDFLCRSRWKISGSNGTSKMVVLYSRTEYSRGKFVFHFFKAVFSTSFRPSRSFLGVWNWFVQMVNAILGQILPVMNFTYHLPKPSTHRFALVNGKQPKLSEKSNFETPDGVPTKAPSTRIRFFFESATFSLRIQKFPRPHVSGFKSNLPVQTHVSGYFWILNFFLCWDRIEYSQ